MGTTTPLYGDHVDESEVSYEPPRNSGEVGRYYRISDHARVVWVLPSNLNATSGFFALYTGPDDSYEPNLVDA